MIRYLKLIVIIFGSIGLAVGSFFFMQNKKDISTAISYNSILDYDYLVKECKNIEDDYYYPCLKEKFSEYLSQVSFTGTNIGMKMVFTAMDHDKFITKKFDNDKIKNLNYSLNYLEINNMAIKNITQRYYGFDFLYGGYIASVGRFSEKAYPFSDNLIIGLEGVDGIYSLNEGPVKQEFIQRFELLKDEYYQARDDLKSFIEEETAKLESKS